MIFLAGLGGETLRGFAVALAIGIVIGTYSSVYVAGAIALDLGASGRDFMPPEKRGEVDELPLSSRSGGLSDRVAFGSRGLGLLS